MKKNKNVEEFDESLEEYNQKEEEESPEEKRKNLLMNLYFIVLFICILNPKLSLFSFAQAFITVGIIFNKKIKGKKLGIPFIIIGMIILIMAISNI